MFAENFGINPSKIMTHCWLVRKRLNELEWGKLLRYLEEESSTVKAKELEELTQNE
jgi:hypothetical protein